MKPLLRMLVGVGYIADGLIILLTLGLWENRPEGFALRASKILARHNSKETVN